MSEENPGQEVPAFDLNDIELPPDVERLLAEIKTSHKTLMRTKAFGTDVGQLRIFIGTHMFAQLQKVLVLLTLGYLDSSSLAASTVQEVKKLRARVRDLEDEIADGAGGGMDTDDEEELRKLNDEMLQALFGLSEVLQKLLPDNKEAGLAFDNCVQAATATQKFLADSDDDDDDDDDDEPEPEPKKPAPEASPPETP